MRRALIGCCAVMFLVGVASTSTRAASPLEARSLQGLPGVYVLVEDFTSEQKKAGFDERGFRTDTELKLRMAGIRVLTREEYLSSPAGAYLYVNVNSFHESRGHSAPYGIQLSLNQLVTLWNGSKASAAATWLATSTGYGDLDYVRQNVKERVDEFVNAWLSVNPKK